MIIALMGNGIMDVGWLVKMVTVTVLGKMLMIISIMIMGVSNDRIMIMTI